jgi:hypothetical protein
LERNAHPTLLSTLTAFDLDGFVHSHSAVPRCRDIQARPLNSYGPSRETRAVVPWAGHHPPHHHFNSDTLPSASTVLSSILDSSECVCCFKYQLDSAVQRWSYRLKRCIADDVPLAFLRDITVLQHVLQLAQHGRARHPDCVCDLLSCESVTTQRSRPQSSRYVRELSKRGYVVRGEDAGNQQALELLCGISQDQPFLPARDVFRSHRLGSSISQFEAQDIKAPGARMLPSVIGGPAGCLGFGAMVARIPWEPSCPLRRRRRSMSLADGGPLWGAERTTFAHREPFRF